MTHDPQKNSLPTKKDPPANWEAEHCKRSFPLKTRNQQSSTMKVCCIKPLSTAHTLIKASLLTLPWNMPPFIWSNIQPIWYYECSSHSSPCSTSSCHDAMAAFHTTAAAPQGPHVSQLVPPGRSVGSSQCRSVAAALGAGPWQDHLWPDEAKGQQREKFTKFTRNYTHIGRFWI